MSIAEAFGLILKKHRKEARLSQEKLALMCNLDRTYIGLLERAERQPSLTTIFKICEQLELAPSAFVKDVEEVLNKN